MSDFGCQGSPYASENRCDLDSSPVSLTPLEADSPLTLATWLSCLPGSPDTKDEDLAWTFSLSSPHLYPVRYVIIVLMICVMTFTALITYNSTYAMLIVWNILI